LFPLKSWVVVAGLLALHLTNPHTWGLAVPSLWFPAAGIGLCLVAWFGRRAAALVLLDGLLVTAQAVVLEYLAPGARSSSALALAGADALIGTAEVMTAWWLYHGLARGNRVPGEPRSATLFLVLVPGVTAGLFALVRATLYRLVGDPLATFDNLIAWFWLSDALGILVVAPPLLAGLTPWFVRRGLAVAEAAEHARPTPDDHVGAEKVTQTAWIEIAAVALAAGLWSLFLISPLGRTGFSGWQLGGLPLLLIILAGARHGVRGGSTVAAASAGLPLAWLADLPHGDSFALFVQSTFLAQCGAGLLVASAGRWIRFHDTHYRQVVGHIPVVIYSARIRAAGEPGALPHAEITLVSAASRTLLGCPPDELLGDYNHWLRRVHPDDREVVLAALSQVTRQSEPVVCEYRLNELKPPPADSTAPDGTPSNGLLPRRPAVRWVRDTLAPRRDAAGRCDGWEGVALEITEQRALADDLRRATSLFNALVANLPAGVFFVQGRRGRPLLVNARARQLLGQREDPSAGVEHLAETYRLHLPDGRPYPVEELPVVAALHRGQTTMRDDIVVHRPDGRRVPLVTWAAPVEFGPAPDVRAAVWVLEDLTALHQAEAARRDTEVRLRAIIETMSEGMIVLDRKGVVVDCNNAVCGLFGAPPEKLRGLTWSEFSRALLREDGSLLQPAESPALTVLRNGRPVRNRVLGLRPGGTTALRWLLVNAMPLGAGNPVAGVVTTFADITAWRQAQEGIRTSEEKYRGLLDALPCMVIQSDLDQRIRYVNPATQSVTGYGVDDISDVAAWMSIIHAEDMPKVAALGIDAMQGKPGRSEIRYRARDGSQKIGYAMTQPNLQDDAVTGVTTVVVDVTRQRLLEEKLQRVQRLELIGRLASGIAHDFNNLLNIVMQLTALARENLPAQHPANEDLERITEVSEQAAQLTAQLLAISKLRPVTLRRVELNDHVRRALKILGSTLPAGIDLIARLADRDLYVRADESQVQQVVMNLCLNARDAMPDGGTLLVETARGCPPGAVGDWVRLSVEDSGQGMTDTVKAHIFEPFFSDKERGTGLGLTIVHQVVEACGGRVEVTSQPGRGARFNVWIPWAADEKAEHSHDTRETPLAASP
jgi:PAS domain S-box-containing protein